MADASVGQGGTVGDGDGRRRSFPMLGMLRTGQGMSGTVEQIGTARPPGAPTPVAVPAAAPTATEAITAVAPAGRFPRRLAMLLAVHVLNFLALLGTVVLGMWGHAALWTLPALAFFVLTWLLLVPVVLIRGMPVGFEERFDKEYRQTITRMLVGSVVEAYAISMVSNLPTVALPYIAVSHLWWGATLLPIIFYLYWPKHDLAARLVSALSDNVAFTLILLSNRTYAAGVWPMYLWAALGNGFRFGVRPLVYNLVLGVLGFAFVVWETPAWRAMPALTVGLFLAQIFLPLYASGLIRRLHEATDAAKKANEVIPTKKINTPYYSLTPHPTHIKTIPDHRPIITDTRVRRALWVETHH